MATPEVPAPTFDLKTYRDFVRTTTDGYTGDFDALYGEDVLLTDFLHKVQPFEKKKWPNALRWDVPATALQSLADNIMHQHKVTFDKIAAVPEGQNTFENTLEPYEILDRLITPSYASLDFVADVSGDAAIRDASNAAKETVSAFMIAQSSRKDLYEAVSRFNKTEEARALTGEYKKMLEDMMRDFKRIGFELNDEDRAKFVELKTRMSSLSIKFQQNLGEEKTTHEFTADQLAGLTEDMLKAFTFNEETKKYTVTLKTPDYIPVMKYCIVPETRAIMEKSYNSRCIDENSPIIEELVKLRIKSAKLLGYPTYSDYILEELMSKSAARVNEFLGDLNTKLTPLYERDNQQLIDAKVSTYKKLGLPLSVDDPNTPEIYAYDRSFLSNIVEKELFSVDHAKIKEYFPMENVMSEMFTTYERLFGLKFVDVTSENRDALYHPDVKLFNVFDTTGKQDPEKLYGQFYFDAHPREGKYGHAAVFPLVAAYQQDGVRSIPIAAVVCNFPKSTVDTPALMTHSDVVTNFHEFGHCLHHQVSQNQLTKYSGTSVLRDFVEAPSQLLENLVATHKPTMMALMKHYKTGESAPEDMVDKLIKADKALSGAFNKRQLVFGILDQTLHQTTDENAKIDTAAIYRQVMKDVMNVEPTPGTNMVAGFGHLAGGYDARYYGYLWALNLAKAIWHKIEQNGVSPEIFREYREKVISKGGTIDPNILVEDFLGEKPSVEPFLISLGLEVDQKQ